MQAAAAVLAGSTFRNTAPQSLTTHLSGLSTGCDLVLHAKTMAPYTALALLSQWSSVQCLCLWNGAERV